MKYTITDTERGFLYKNGKFIKMLQPGVYRTFGSNTEIQPVLLSVPLHEDYSREELAVLAADAQFKAETVSVKVGDGQLALHFEDGRYVNSLTSGCYVYWNTVKSHTFQFCDITAPNVKEDIPRHICEKLQAEGKMVMIEIPEQHKGILYFDRAFQRVLECGVYYFWKMESCVKVLIADLRRKQMSITGQELLTKDKVTIRMNFLCDYRFTDFLKAHTEITDYSSQFYYAVQMAMREYVAGCTLDELLADREGAAAAVMEKLNAKAGELYLEVLEVGIRDIILPGEIRDIMNTVLIAEKRAQANVITRREEVASTRSLLNTAKLMDENKTLYKLKELEYLERICENVGNISVSSGDLLTQLREIVTK
ncbi:MAG: slipin family protein [Ruminococcus sp.]|nr:slipin family protein [Ruminococcus sp.]